MEEVTPTANIRTPSLCSISAYGIVSLLSYVDFPSVITTAMLSASGRSPLLTLNSSVCAIQRPPDVFVLAPGYRVESTNDFRSSVLSNWSREKRSRPLSENITPPTFTKSGPI